MAGCTLLYVSPDPVATDALLLPRSDTAPVPGASEEPRTTNVGGVDVAWAEVGAGPPLVLLHGLGDFHRTWRRVAPTLARRFRVLMPDLPGHGRSARPDARYDLDWYAHIIADWMDVIGVRRAHLCGHSYGGGVALWMVVNHRARVDRLALVAAGGLGREVPLGLRLAALPIPPCLYTPALMRLGTRLALKLAPQTFGYPEAAEARAVAEMNARPGSGTAFCRTVRGVIRYNGQYVRTCREATAAESLPPLALFWGDHDRVLPLSHGRTAMQRFEGATLSVFSGCGHFPHLQYPQRFSNELTEFLSDQRRAPAQLEFACPEGPGAKGPRALPIAQCRSCTWRPKPPIRRWHGLREALT